MTWKKPTALRLLQGNPSRRPLPTAEPTSPAPSVTPPADLPPEGKKRWRSIMRRLVAAKIATKLDTESVRLLVDSMLRYERANEVVRQHGMVVKSRKGVPMLSPFWIAATHEAKTISSLLAQLGMTPSARSRVKETQAPGAPSAWSEY